MSENERPEYLDGAAPLNAEREAELRATLTEKIRRIHEAERHPAKLWLWRNHVDGRPEYWAFDNPYPIHMDNGDPQTLGEPCGYALVKPSRNGRPDVPESVVLNSIERACARVVELQCNDTRCARKSYGGEKQGQRCNMPQPQGHNCSGVLWPAVSPSNVAQPADDWIALVLRDVAEIPDRTSPDEGPEFLIVTGEELRMIIERRAPVGTPVVARPDGMKHVADIVYNRETGEQRVEPPKIQEQEGYVGSMAERSKLREAVLAAFPLLRRIRDRTDAVQFFEANAVMGMMEEALRVPDTPSEERRS